MYRPFRLYHMLRILEDYEQQSYPLDYFLSHYFRSHKALGPKDRGVIAETLYAILRWKGLIDFLCEHPISWEGRLSVFLNTKLNDFKQKTDIPLHIRLSFPKVLFDLLVESYGIEKASEICGLSNYPAPTTIRVNTLKINRDELLHRWKNLHKIRPTTISSTGIVFERKINFYATEEFKQGLFEVQDEGSQLIAQLVKATPGQLVMDYCSGSGGKTLAFAPSMQNKGQIYLHDIRKHSLMDSKKRLRRAGIQNAQIIYENDIKLKKLKKSMDWVLVDAPCTGTGTMRRNPDMKWKFEDQTLERLVGQQRMIFEKALSFLAPNGLIVYATCSVLKQENEQQAAHFMKTYNLERVDSFTSLPMQNGMDGFYGIVLKKNI